MNTFIERRQLDLYLFNVDHGQCVAIWLPNGYWCIFDLGSKDDFDPIEFIRDESLKQKIEFSIYRAFISHLHEDHLSSLNTLIKYGSTSYVCPEFDERIFQGLETNYSNQLSPNASKLINWMRRFPDLPGTFEYSYGGASISLLYLETNEVHHIGGNLGNRVNNTSIVSRLDYLGNSILICGDMEKEGWDYALSTSAYRNNWSDLVANIDVLIAPHHGHTSGYSEALMSLAKPKVVLVSVASRDKNVDTRYSGDAVHGIVNPPLLVPR